MQSKITLGMAEALANALKVRFYRKQAVSKADVEHFAYGYIRWHLNARPDQPLKLKVDEVDGEYILNPLNLATFVLLMGLEVPNEVLPEQGTFHGQLGTYNFEMCKDLPTVRFAPKIGVSHITIKVTL